MNSKLKSLLPHLVVVGIFILLAGLFVGPVFKGYKISAHDSDQHLGMSKEIRDHREEFQEEPLWTNAMFGGMPSFQISTLYPKNLVKGIDKALTLGLPHPAGIIFKTLFGFYILLIALKMPWKWAGAGAIAFAFSSYFIIILEAGHNSKANAVAYMAPTIAGLILAYRGKYLVGMALTALFLSLELIANHFQVTYYLGLSLLIFGIVELVQAIRTGTIKNFMMASGVGIGALVIALMVNNTNMRLTKDYLPETQRGKSELAIKAEMAQKRKEQMEAERLKKIEEAKNDKTKEFNEADFLPEKEAYATRWSYGLGESFTLLIPNLRGGGSADANKETETYKTFKRYFKSAPPYNRMPKKEREKITSQQTGASLYWGKQPGVNGPVYVGAGIVALFLLGLVLVKSHLKWWILGTALLGLLISWGKNFLPFFQTMFDYFPLYDSLRAVTIGMVITELAAPLLGFLLIKEIIQDKIDRDYALKMVKYIGGAFLGVLLLVYMFGPGKLDFVSGTENAQLVDDLIKDRKALFKADVLRSFGFALATLAVVYVLVAGKKEHTKYASIALAAISLMDLWGVDKRYLNEDKFVKEKDIMEESYGFSPASQFIENHSKGAPYRVLNLSRGFGSAINDATTAYYHHDIGGYSSVKLMVYQDLLDFELGQECRQIESVVQNMQKQAGRTVPQYMDGFMQGQQVVNMLNTKYIIDNPNGEPYVNPYAYGPCWLVGDVVYYDNPDSIMFNLNTKDLRSVALTQNEALKGKTFGADGQIQQSDYKANHITYDYNSTTPSFAVFSEVYYKDWVAYVDGSEQPIEKVNYALRGLELPAGQHKIEFKFEPSIYHSGENISLIGCLILFGLLGFTLFKSYKSLQEG